MARILVTGASRGIGLELCKQLAARGDEVIAACRRSNEALAALDVSVVEGIDVTRAESMDQLAGAVDRPLDTLVLNAGILVRETIDSLDFDMMRAQFEVNAMGPLRVVQALRSRLHAGAKVAIITSRMGSIADNTSGRMYGYRMSKAAVNIAGVSLAHDLLEQGVSVQLLHPGSVRTDMTGGHGMVEADFSVRGLIERIDAMSMQNTGTFWHAQGETLPWLSLIHI